MRTEFDNTPSRAASTITLVAAIIGAPATLVAATVVDNPIAATGFYLSAVLFGLSLVIRSFRRGDP